MAPQIKCVKCSGNFGPTLFENRAVKVCRFCQLSEKGKAEIKALQLEIKSAHERIDDLVKEISAKDDELRTLREFTSANIASGSSSGVESSAQRSYRDVAATTPADETVSRSRTDEDTPFQVVRNGVHPKKKKVIEPVVCDNRFQILMDQTDEEEEVRLVGDSIVRGQLKEFCARAPKRRKRFCIPGGGLDDVDAAIEEVANLAPPNTTYVVHIGTNDVARTRSEELLAKYKKLIQKFKDKSGNVIISGILPRWENNRQFLTDATLINHRLALLCSDENVEFVNLWDEFYYDRSLFWKDGIHLNQVGSARFGRLLSEAVDKYRSKNETARVQGEEG